MLMVSFRVPDKNILQIIVLYIQTKTYMHLLSFSDLNRHIYIKITCAPDTYHIF